MLNESPVEFLHERLDVYQRSIEFFALVLPIANHLPRGYSTIAVQIRRAAPSIPLNIAEGCGRTGEDDSARHFSIARGSALECAAALDLVKVIRGARSEQIASARRLLFRIVQMLSKMCR